MRSLRVWAVLIPLFILIGCSDERQESSIDGAAQAVSAAEDGLARVEMSVDRTDIRAVDDVTLLLSIALPEQHESLPMNLDEQLDVAWLADDPVTAQAPPAEGDDRPRTLLTYRLEPLATGELPIGPIEMRHVDPAGAERTLRIAPVVVTVRSVVTDDSSEIAPERGVAEAPADQRALWLLIGAVAIGVTMLAAGVVAAVRYAHRARPAAPPRPADEVALERLDELLQRDLVGAGRVQEFYHEISLILRRYIEDRFGLRAPEQTTEEFLEATRHSEALWTEDVRILAYFLQHCDLVKFARAEPDDLQIRETIETVRTFIRRTRRVEAPAGEERDA
ncbi:MAG: hypothetical protein RIB32_02720 [Phycisphaerales bacterium]